MNNLIIFLGDVQDYIADLAKDHDPESWHLTGDNLDKLETEIKIRDVTVYTALGDLPKNLDVVFGLLSRAHKIFYRPPVIWSDNKNLDVLDPSSSLHGLTEKLLLLLPTTVNIDGPDLYSVRYDPIPLVDQRKSSQPQLWVAGCSISHGVGVDVNERFGQLLSDSLDVPCSFLTRPGSAIDWAADQILRSDIKQDDVVIWGLTEGNRLTYVHDHQLLHGITIGTFKNNPSYQKIIKSKDLFSSQTHYRHLYSLQQVINYCKKIGAKLFLVGLLFGNYSFLGFLRSQKNYIHIPYQMEYENQQYTNKFLDLGTDGRHPGPRQHQQYKTIILDFLYQS